MSAARRGPAPWPASEAERQAGANVVGLAVLLTLAWLVVVALIVLSVVLGGWVWIAAVTVVLGAYLGFREARR